MSTMTLQDQIKQVIDTEPVVVFIKGTPEAPACGNSMRALQALWQAGAPIMETAKTWISGDFNGAYYPHTVTFEPSCGRVLYSTYHTADSTHAGLYPQERVLMYLLMEIGTCKSEPIIE